MLEDDLDISTISAEDGLSGDISDDIPMAACWLKFRAQVNVRSGPDTSYSILDVATPNDHLPVTGRTLDGNWWRVDHGGETGWVSAGISNVRLSGDCSSVPAVEIP